MQDKEYKVNKNKCVGCGTCAAICPQGLEIGSDNKATVISSAMTEECGGEELCAYGAIEAINGVSLTDEEE